MKVIAVPAYVGLLG